MKKTHWRDLNTFCCVECNDIATNREALIKCDVDNNSFHPGKEERSTRPFVSIVLPQHDQKNRVTLFHDCCQQVFSSEKILSRRRPSGKLHNKLFLRERHFQSKRLNVVIFFWLEILDETNLGLIKREKKRKMLKKKENQEKGNFLADGK